jgi:hypothetical protein
MIQNPLHSTDINYGVPVVFTEILDDLIEQEENGEDDDSYLS